jgi:3-deoxy-7-phosphoheptulonate synthase
VGDRLLLVMRSYFEKPRTGLGWKGWISDPYLDGSDALGAGLRSARRLLCELNEVIPCASEILDPSVAPYLTDLLSWVAIGARTSESQPHRELASGLAAPVGFKNPIDGRVAVALNAMEVARSPHTRVAFDTFGQAHAVRTAGNPDVHLVLRGSDAGPNCSAEHVDRAVADCRSAGASRGVMVDCSHGNSGKEPANQPAVLRDVIAQFEAGQRGLMGVMLESHLQSGRQSWRPGETLDYGVSLTDGCLGWDDTEQLLLDAVRALPKRGPLAAPSPLRARPERTGERTLV